MAINPNTLAEFIGRITAPTPDYPYGSSKNESSPGAGDGTPYLKARADDIFGFQQALLKTSGLVPSGNADTALASQYLQSLIQQVLGRGFLYDDSGVADAYIVELRTDQQSPGAVFEGLAFSMVAQNANTGAATVDISALKGEVPGTTVLNVFLPDGSTNPSAGQIPAGSESNFIYRTTPSPYLELVRPDYTEIGVNQTWQNVLVSRSPSVTYTNTTGKPIQVIATSRDNAIGIDALITMTIDGQLISRDLAQANSSNSTLSASAIVPAGSTYSVGIGSDEVLQLWWELR